MSPEQKTPLTISLLTDEALRIGIHLHKTDALADAEALYRRIIESEPGNLDALHYLAVLSHQVNRHHESFDLIRKILDLDPKNADAHNNLGNVLEALGRFPEAEEYYRKAIALRPDHAPALNNLGVQLMSQKNYTEAADTLRKAISLSPANADFRYNLGNALRKSEEYDHAIAVYREALGLSPNHEGAWRGMARCYLLTGRPQEAADAFGEWLRLDPGNELAMYLRASCLGEEVPARAPDAYICQVFDNMAVRFDTHLIENLEYRAPDLLAQALGAALPPSASSLDILDAGCGTGLCGKLLKPFARCLTGVDLSSGMLVIAKERKLYDHLVTGELTGFLHAAPEVYDIVASSDTLCYFGPLEPVFQAAYSALKPGGLLAFTLEDAGDDAPPWGLNPTARYSHQRAYVTGALRETGFAVHSLTSEALRNESQQPVKGHVVVARKDACRRPGMSQDSTDGKPEAKEI